MTKTYQIGFSCTVTRVFDGSENYSEYEEKMDQGVLVVVEAADEREACASLGRALALLVRNGRVAE